MLDGCADADPILRPDWTLSLLLGRKGVRSVNFSPRRARALAWSQQQLFCDLTEAQLSEIWEQKAVHHALDLSGPFTRLCVEPILRSFVTNAFQNTNWTNSDESVCSFLAFMAVQAYVKAVSLVEKLPKESVTTQLDRERAVERAVALVYDNFKRAQPYWRQKAFRGMFAKDPVPAGPLRSTFGGSGSTFGGSSSSFASSSPMSS